MIKCKLFNFLFSAFSLKVWQDFLIRYHFQNCRSCQEKIASSEEAKKIMVEEDQTGNLDSFWLKLKPELARAEKKERVHFRPWLKWAAAAALMTAAVAAVVWLYFLKATGENPSSQSPIRRFQINYLKVENKPASAFIFKPQDSAMIIVWAEKNI